MRKIDELFSNGKIFEAKNKELDSILTEFTSDPDTNLPQYKKLIRAITVLTVKNNRSANRIQILLVLLAISSVYLSIIQTRLSIQQADYTEISTRAARIDQNISLRQGADYCKQNPTSTDSGLFFDNGKSATCAEVLKSSKIKNLDNK